MGATVVKRVVAESLRHRRGGTWQKEWDGSKSVELSGALLLSTQSFDRHDDVPLSCFLSVSWQRFREERRLPVAGRSRIRKEKRVKRVRGGGVVSTSELADSADSYQTTDRTVRLEEGTTRKCYRCTSLAASERRQSSIESELASIPSHPIPSHPNLSATVIHPTTKFVMEVPIQQPPTRQCKWSKVRIPAMAAECYRYPCDDHWFPNPTFAQFG